MRGQGQHTPSESACEPVLNEQPSLSGEYHFTYSPAEMLFNRHTPQVQGIISSRLNAKPKEGAKVYADNKRGAKYSNVNVRDTVLILHKGRTS